MSSIRHWMTMMDLRAIPVEDIGSVAFGQPLVDGQHRLAVMREPSYHWRAMQDEAVREYFRRRRMVRVTTLKYRARKRRRK